MSNLRFKGEIYFIVLITIATILFSCQQDRDTWGSSFIPEEDKLHIQECVTSQFDVWTDTVALTSQMGVTSPYIGEIYDPQFGLRRTYILSQLIPNVLYWPHYELGLTTFDSVFFGFRIQETYQDEPLQFTLSQLEKEIKLSDTAHLASVNKMYKPLGTVEVTPKRRNLVRIPLDKTVWAKKFLDEGTQHLTSYPTWLIYSPGFRLEAKRKLPTPNKGAMVKLNFNDENTGLFFYWKKDDTVRSIRLGLLSNQLKRFVGIERDFVGSVLEETLKKKSLEQDAEQHSYVEALGDVRTVIDLSPVYEQWRDSLPVTVMRAELQIPLAAENAPLGDTLISRLYVAVKSGDTYIVSPDVDKAKVVYDGYYNRQAQYYSLNITYSIQALLLNQLPGNKLYLLGDAEYLGFGRAILSNGKSATTPMRLSITYTRH